MSNEDLEEKLNDVIGYVSAKESLPDELAKWLIDNFLKVTGRKVSTMDEAFGYKELSDSQLKINNIGKDVWFELYSLRRTEGKKKWPLDEGTFETIGKKFNLKSGTVKDYYYHYQSRLNISGVSVKY